MDSIYVTKDKQMRWMIGDFQFALEFNSLEREIFEKTKDLRYSETITPEEGMKKFQKYTATCRDVWAFEKLASKIFAEIEESAKKANIQNKVTYQTFLKLPAIKFWMSKALESEPQSRATFASFLKLKIFEQDPLCNIMLFFDDMRLKKQSEKETFFRELKQQTSKLSVPLLKKRILPRMLTLPFITEPACSTFLAHLFSVKDTNGTSKKGVEGILESKDFDEHIVTFIRKCYQSKNYSLRMRILQTLEYYQNQLSFPVVTLEVIPEIMRGIKDSSNELVMFTMNACVLFSKVLSRYDQTNQTTTGSDIINNQFLVSMHHYAVQNTMQKVIDINESATEALIALRSHSLLCMLELWNLPGVNKGIILTALHSNLFDKDIFEVKVHALNVILIHMSRFDPRELMTYVLKAVLPLTLHEKEQVRSKAQQVMKMGLEYINESDISKCNLGMITSINDGINNVVPFFPPQSKLEIVRHEIYSGQSPKNVIQFGNTSDSPQQRSNDNEDQSSGSPVPASTEITSEKTPERTEPEYKPASMKLPTKAAASEAKEQVKEQVTPVSEKKEENDEWNSWSDEEDNKQSSVQTIQVENNVSRAVVAKSTPTPERKLPKLAFDSDQLEEGKFEVPEKEDKEQDLFADFSVVSKKENPSPSISTQKKAKQGGRNGKTRRAPTNTIAKNSPQTSEEEPKESNMSKLLQEEEGVDNSAWDEIDMFSQMEIK